jgi:succinate dehydrogenase/fumarate reductase flavoprotein subunit
VGGATYAGRTGFTSNFFGLQGKRSAEAASDYVKSSGLALEKIAPETVQSLAEEYTAPMRLEKGYDAVWALDCLQAVMTPFWTLLVKSEDRLKAALVNVIYMRDHVLPKVMALSAHDLRNCTELRHKVLQAEMKLRLSLERKESRGCHYREDYPFRDDKNYLCYLVAQRGDNDEMEVHRVEYPDAWKGNRSEPYLERYTSYFPGEKEAAAAHGLL